MVNRHFRTSQATSILVTVLSGLNDLVQNNLIIDNNPEEDSNDDIDDIKQTGVDDNNI